MGVCGICPWKSWRPRPSTARLVHEQRNSLAGRHAKVKIDASTNGRLPEGVPVLRTIEATFEIVTPMFLGGANNRTTAELRVPSIKAALRFWWRALAWGRTSGCTTDRLKKIKSWEDILFGSARSGTGAFSMAFTRPPGKASPGRQDLNSLVGGYDAEACDALDSATWRRGGGIAYLAGQGLTKWSGPMRRVIDSRPSLPEAKTFSIALACPAGTGSMGADLATNLEQCAPSVVEALELFSLVGSLGSRVRRGFGSIRLCRIEPPSAVSVPRNAREYRDRLHAVFENASKDSHDAGADQIPFTALSRFTSAIAVDGLSGWKSWQCHADAGHGFQLYRSYGFGIGAGPSKRHVVNDQPSRKNFSRDHDWMCEVLDHTDKTRAPAFSGLSLPERSIMGLPHAYGTRREPDQRLQVNTSEEGRRASPLFLHVHTFDEGPPVAVWTLFPCQFLPDQTGDRVDLTIFSKEKVTAHGRDSWADKTGPWSETFDVDFGPIQTFLDDPRRDFGARRKVLRQGDKP
jgi:CRISPR-associated protein Cmr1